jgi:hypothetical protein
MVTFLIIAAVLSIAVGLWILNNKQNKGLNEANDSWINDLAPEATPESAIIKTIAKKATPAPKKKAVVSKKAIAKKSVKKSK